MKNLIIHMFTGIDGLTFDPARVVGYGAAIGGVAVFLGCTVYHVIKSGAFDYVAYGAGFTGVCAGIAAVGVGVAAKAKTEPQA